MGGLASSRIFLGEACGGSWVRSISSEVAFGVDLDQVRLGRMAETLIFSWWEAWVMIVTCLLLVLP